MAKLKPIIKESPIVLLQVMGLFGAAYLTQYMPFAYGGIGVTLFLMNDYIDTKCSSKWYALFTKLKLGNVDGEIPRVVKSGENDIGPYYLLEMPTGVSISDIGKQEERLEEHFLGQVEIKREADYKVRLQIIKVKFKSKYPVDLRNGQFKQLSKKRYLIGVVRGDKPFQLDFDKGAHMLLNGGTGGGKTTLLRLIMAQAVLRGVTLLGTDMKGGAEFMTFLGYEGLVLSTDKQSSRTAMANLAELMHRRYDHLGKSGCKDAKEYNKKNNVKMEPILCVVDEFSPFRNDKEIKGVLDEILSMARAANINVILSSQRISSKVMGDLKANMDIRATFKTLTDADSEIALGRGNTQASNLPKEGRILLRYDGYAAKQIQCYFLDNDECKDQLKEQLSNSSFVIRDRGAYELDMYTGRARELREEIIETEEMAGFLEIEDYYVE